MATLNDIIAAREAAIGVMRGAAQFIQTFSGTHCWSPDWPSRGRGKGHRAQVFGQFIRRVDAANTAVHAVDSVLPIPDRPVRYGGIVAGTAHAVAVKFANGIVGEISGALSDSQGEIPDDDLEHQADLYNSALSGEVDPDYLDQSQAYMRAALSATEVIDTEELYFHITNEAKLAIRLINGGRGEQTTPVVDGPAPPGKFLWNGHQAVLAPKPFKLLCLTWEKESTPAMEAVEHLWPGEIKDATDLRNHITKINNALSEVCYPQSLGVKSDYLVWS